MTTTCVKENTMTLTVTNNVIKQAVKTYSMSKKYMITMLQASVLNIMYHRLYVDENEFVKKSFNNIDFKSCRRKSKNEVIRQYHTFLIAAKEALDKGYLREFYLFFVDGATDDIVENYKFSFKYPKDDARVQVDSQDLIKTTCDLLKTLNDLANHDKLYPGVQVKAELTYFDYTPLDYQPPLFVDVNDSDSLKSKLGKKGNSVMLGSLCTGFHCLKCRARGKVFNFNGSTTGSEVTEKENRNPRGDLTPRSSKQVANDKLKIMELTEEPGEDPPKKRLKSSKLEDKLMIEELSEVPGKMSPKKGLKIRKVIDFSSSSTACAESALICKVNENENKNQSGINTGYNMQAAVNEELMTEDLTEKSDKISRKKGFGSKKQLKNRVFSNTSTSYTESAVIGGKKLYEINKNEDQTRSGENTESNMKVAIDGEVMTEDLTKTLDKTSRKRGFGSKKELKNTVFSNTSSFCAESAIIGSKKKLCEINENEDRNRIAQNTGSSMEVAIDGEVMTEDLTEALDKTSRKRSFGSKNRLKYRIFSDSSISSAESAVIGGNKLCEESRSDKQVAMTNELMTEDLTETLDKTSRKRSFGSKNRLKYRILSDSSISSAESAVMGSNKPCEESRSSNQVAIMDELMTEDLTEEPKENQMKNNFVDLTEDIDEGQKKKSVLKEKLKIRKFNDTYISEYIIDVESGDEEILPINCPCELPVVDSWVLDQIQCSKCKETYHAACVGYLDKTFVEDNFSCYNCGTPDEVMKSSPARICKIRYFMGIVYKYGKIPHDFDVRYTNIFTTLESLEIFRREGNKWICNTNAMESLFKFNKKPLQKDFWFESLCED